MPGNSARAPILALAAFLCPEASATAAGITDLNKAPDLFSKAAAAGAAAAVAALYATEALLLAPGSPVIKGREAIEALNARNHQAGRNVLRFTDFTVDAGSDRAVILWAWTMSIDEADGGKVENRGRSMLYLRKGSGGWYIAGHVSTGTTIDKRLRTDF